MPLVKLKDGYLNYRESPAAEMLDNLMQEMTKYFEIDQDTSWKFTFYLARDHQGMESFCKWVKSKYQLTIIPYRLKEDDRDFILAFDIIEDEFYTEYLLKK